MLTKRITRDSKSSLRLPLNTYGICVCVSLPFLCMRFVGSVVLWLSLLWFVFIMNSRRWSGKRLRCRAHTLHFAHRICTIFARFFLHRLELDIKCLDNSSFVLVKRACEPRCLPALWCSMFLLRYHFRFYSFFLLFRFVFVFIPPEAISRAKLA